MVRVGKTQSQFQGFLQKSQGIAWVNVTLEDLRVFITVYKTGNLSAGRCARISIDGSTATTWRPGGSYEPVPAPTFRTLRAALRAV